MRGTQRLFALTSIWALLASSSLAQDPIKQIKKHTVSAAAAASTPVSGSGTAGQIARWTGVDASNTYSNIFEDKLGKIGIGTKTPTSLLTVQGMIETTIGGYKFPDGTVQTTAGLAFVTHDSSLMGDGRIANPLGIALSGVNTIHLANNAVTAPKIANGTVVRSLNGLFDNVSLAEGSNIRITQSGNTLTIASPNSLTSISHDSTLTGTGTVASPLGVAVPFILSGSSASSVLSATNSASGEAVRGNSTSGVGVSGEGLRGVNGKGNDNSNSFGNGGAGMFAQGGTSNGSRGGEGVFAQGGRSNTGPGGFSVFGIGGDSGDGGAGMHAEGGAGSGAGNRSGDGIFAKSGSGSAGANDGLAGRFLGDVDVAGKLTKTMGTFKIDHPLDPENKYLYHSFVESPDMLNIYNGNFITDQNGDAIVVMPDYFDALNRDFRYQLTVIGQFAQAIVASEMKDNRFGIKTNAPDVKVSWMVTGVRQDAYAEKNRVRVEEVKAEKERGYYLHPEVFNQPEEKSIEWARNPEMMQRLKQQRLQAEEKMKKQQ